MRLGPARSALLALVAVAAILRLIMPPAHPDAFQPDEVVNGYDAFCLAHIGADHHGNRWPLLFESFGDWVSPLLTYVTAPFVALGGLSAFTIRLPGVIANVLAVAAIALLTFEFTASRVAALVAAALLATSPWDIALAQWAAAPTLLPLLATLALLFALRTIRTRAWRDALALGVAAALLVYDYPTQKLFAPLLVVVACLALRGWRERGIAIASCALLSAPMVALTLSDPKYNARFAYVGLDPHAPDFARNVFARYVEYLDPAFLFRHGDMSFAPVFEPLYAAGIVLTLVALATGRGAPALGRRAAAFVLAMLLLAPLPASLTVDHLHPNRSLQLLALALLLMASGAAALGALISSRLVRVGLAVALAGMLIGTTVQFGAKYYGGRHVQTGFAEEQAGLGDAIVALVAREPNAAIVVDTSAFNQPYIYYLFAARYDCAKLPLAQMRASQTGVFWAYVSAIDGLRFRPVDAGELAATLPLEPIDEGPNHFQVRQGNGNVYLLH